jgi:hypothetical protein
MLQYTQITQLIEKIPGTFVFDFQQSPALGVVDRAMFSDVDKNLLFVDWQCVRLWKLVRNP